MEKTAEVYKINEALHLISGKWRPAILITLQFLGTQRFNELQRLIPGITQKMLTSQLKELEHAGVISRKVYAEVPPKVEYSLSEYGKTLSPILCMMHEWGGLHLARQATHSAQQD